MTILAQGLRLFSQTSSFDFSLPPFVPPCSLYVCTFGIGCSGRQLQSCKNFLELSLLLSPLLDFNVGNFGGRPPRVVQHLRSRSSSGNWQVAEQKDSLSITRQHVGLLPVRGRMQGIGYLRPATGRVRGKRRHMDPVPGTGRTNGSEDEKLGAFASPNGGEGNLRGDGPQDGATP